MRARRHACVLAALAVAGAGAGCGGSGARAGSPPSSGGGRALREAVAATADAGSARFAMRMQMQTRQGDVTLRGGGVLGLDGGRRARLTAALRSPGSVRALALEERMLGAQLFLRAPGLTHGIPGAKAWVRLDAGALASDGRIDLPALLNASGDPTQALVYLRNLTGGVRRMGPATVDGEPTVRYRAAISLPKLAARLPQPSRDGFLRLMGAPDVLTEPIDVWVDRHGMVRQEAFRFGMPAVSARMTMRLNLRDFGVPVHVSRPPAEQTSDFAALLAGATGP